MDKWKRTERVVNKLADPTQLVEYERQIGPIKISIHDMFDVTMRVFIGRKCVLFTSEIRHKRINALAKRKYEALERAREKELGHDDYFEDPIGQPSRYI